MNDHHFSTIAADHRNELLAEAERARLARSTSTPQRSDDRPKSWVRRRLGPALRLGRASI